MGNAIDMGSRYICAAIEADIPIPLVIRKNEHKIWVWVFGMAGHPTSDQDYDKSKREAELFEH